jgi:DNA-binding beta-propeller fold protein YncE
MGQFTNPDGIAIDSSGNVYVSDTINNDRVQKFTPNGVHINQWGNPGHGNNQFENPAGIAVGSSGNIYVVDQNNSRIEKFSSNGTYLSQWGTPGDGDGQFNKPNGIAVDPAGNVYVVDTANNRIQKFGPTCAPLVVQSNKINTLPFGTSTLPSTETSTTTAYSLIMNNGTPTYGACTINNQNQKTSVGTATSCAQAISLTEAYLTTGLFSNQVCHPQCPSGQTFAWSTATPTCTLINPTVQGGQFLVNTAYTCTQ